MRMFGRSNGGGRRQAPRESLPLPATLSTLRQTRSANVADLSATGARLRGADLPAIGDPVELWMDCVRAFGLVAWSKQGECGVEFDPPLPPFEVERLRRLVRLAMIQSAGLEAAFAVPAWATRPDGSPLARTRQET